MGKLTSPSHETLISINGGCQLTPVFRFSTVRPMKKLDAAGSQRLSTEFLGSGSVRRHPHPTALPPQSANSGLTPNTHAGPSSQTTSVPVADAGSPARRKPVNAKGRAGQALVEEVVLGVLDSVSHLSD